jgi:DNA-binding NtrC family response regulator
LRERGSDTALLAQHFLDEMNREAGTSKRFSSQAMERLHGHRWPGNVRELKNMVHRAYILSTDLVIMDDPPSTGKNIPQVINGLMNFTIGTALAEAQRDIILATLRHYQGNKRLTANTLGISLKTLYNRLKEY